MLTGTTTLTTTEGITTTPGKTKILDGNSSEMGDNNSMELLEITLIRDEMNNTKLLVFTFSSTFCERNVNNFKFGYFQGERKSAFTTI